METLEHWWLEPIFEGFQTPGKSHHEEVSLLTCPSVDCNWRGCEVATSCKEQRFGLSKRRIAIPYDGFLQVHLMELVNKCWRPASMASIGGALYHPRPARLLDIFKVEDFPQRRPYVTVSGASSNK